MKEFKPPIRVVATVVLSSRGTQSPSVWWRYIPTWTFTFFQKEKQAAAPVSGDLSFESLRKAKELSAEFGGIEKAKEALDALIQLTG